MKIKQSFMKAAEKIAEKVTSSLSQNTGVYDGEQYDIPQGMSEVLRQTASEGAVLLENSILPFEKGSRVSVFGRVQKDHFYTGYGSGGDVNADYKVNLIDGLRACDELCVNEDLAAIYENWCTENPAQNGIWGMWPHSHPEMPVSKSLAEQASAHSDCAVIILGRSSGEDRDNALKKGSYYLTDDEKQLIETVCSSFEKTAVLLNIGCIMDFTWINELKNKPGAVMVLWQGGMESGNAAADLLSGKVTPSGSLTDTVAKAYDLYPSSKDFLGKKYNNYTEDIYVGYRYFETFKKEDVLYPFGHGLSYTDFTYEAVDITSDDDKTDICVKVTNVGDKYAGKDTLMLFLKKPCANLGNPARVLTDFVKTKLLAPGESEKVVLSIYKEQLLSFDDSGVTGNKNCYVLLGGEYSLYLGEDVRNAKKIHSFAVEKTIPVLKVNQACAPKMPFDIITAKESDSGEYEMCRTRCAVNETDLKKRILENLPKGIEITSDKGYKLDDVKQGKVTLDEFTAQLTLDELEAISRGDYKMGSPLGAQGNAGAFGGVLPSLREKGIPPIITTDGPSGIRLACNCSLLPIGTLLASTFNKELVRQLYQKVSEEMVVRGSDVLLAPGMNIHRNPLCGRNFEYLSEDPFVSGMIAASIVEGVQAGGVSACPKHFACNNQELRRNTNDSRVSQRALREIYLKGFEICVKKSKPVNIMTSYNKVNGVWSHYNYDLCTEILRNEWKYEGNVMTDWWMKSSKSPEFPNIRDNAYRVRAQVDVLMPGGGRFGKEKPDGTLLKTVGKEDGITIGELQRTAKNVLKTAIWFSEQNDSRK